MKNILNYIISGGAASAFIIAAHYLPGDILLAVFSSGLFLIPTAFFVGIIQKLGKAHENSHP